jgi:hypothetical protein
MGIVCWIIIVAQRHAANAEFERLHELHLWVIDYWQMQLSWWYTKLSDGPLAAEARPSGAKSTVWHSSSLVCFMSSCSCILIPAGQTSPTDGGRGSTRSGCLSPSRCRVRRRQMRCQRQCQRQRSRRRLCTSPVGHCSRRSARPCRQTTVRALWACRQARRHACCRLRWQTISTRPSR